MNYYPRFPGDYMRKTMHLSMVEDGAYTRLLDWYYSNDRHIPHDRRYAVARAVSVTERAAVDAVLAEFFTLAGGQHRNERADDEIAAASKRIEAAKLNGSKGGRKPKDNPAGNPLGSDPVNPNTNPNTNLIESSLSPYSLRSEEKGANAPSSAGAAVAPPLKAVPLGCPQDRIRALYAEILPSLPTAKLWGNDRQTALRARWGEMAKLKGWASTDEGVEWFRKFFGAVAEDDWLMGRAKRSSGHENWECSIDYLLTAKGFRKVFEGAGRVREAA